MKLSQVLMIAILMPSSAFAIEGGGTTLRCDDATGDESGIYINYGDEWVNDGSMTRIVDFTGWGIQGKRFEVQKFADGDPSDFPVGVVADVSLQAPSASKDNRVVISYKGDQYEFVLSVRSQDIHRDSYKTGGGDDYNATYSFPGQAEMTDKVDGGANPPLVRKMKCRANSGKRGSAG